MELIRDYIFFCKGNTWRRWIQPIEFGHCFIVRRCGTSWLLLDPMKHGLDTKIIEAKMDFPDRLARLKGYCFVEHRSEPNNSQRIDWWDCVSTVKYMAGIKAPWWVISPYGLYKFLKKKAVLHGWEFRNRNTER